MTMIGKFASNLVAVGAVSALIFASADSNAFRVAGEKQDGGLGGLTSNCAAAEFQRASDAVAGEKRDSGLGELSLNTYAR